MRRIPPILPALLLLLPAASPAEPLAVHEWHARPADPRPYAGRIPHGSAARLVARLPGPAASATFHWQTNGMGRLWWETPAECASNAVSVLWTPAMDTGAAVHRAFFRIAQPEGPDYSAFATLAMLDSPGFEPGALPLPVQTLDFAAVSWTNAPWITEHQSLADYATTGLVAEAAALAPSGLGPWRVDSGLPDGYELASVFPSETPVGVLWVVGIRPAGSEDEPDFGTVPGSADALAIVVGFSAPAATVALSRSALSYRLGPDDGPNASKLLAPAGDYATTGYVARAIADALPDPDGGGEWATNAFCYVTWSPETSPSQVVEEDWKDARRLVRRDAGVLSSRLHAWREIRGEEFVVEELAGAWEIVAGAEFATLSNNVLHATGQTGSVAVRFAGGGQALSALVPMAYTLPGSTVIAPCGELHPSNGTWRTYASLQTAVGFTNAPTLPASRYRHGRGGEPDYWCEGIPDALQLYTASETRNPRAANPSFFDPALADLLRCQSVGRTDFQTGADTRPALFVSPHIALCAAHYTPATADFCLDRQTATFQRFAFRKLTGGTGLPADLGDLRLLWSDAEFPTNLLPRFLRAADLARFSETRYAAGIGLYQSQHGTVHPCIVWPVRDDGDGWAAIHPGFDGVLAPLHGRNDTWSGPLSPYGHTVHGGDSGHCVFLRWPLADEQRDVLIPVGLYHYGTGSSESLLSPRVQDWLDAEMGKYGEAPQYLEY